MMRKSPLAHYFDLIVLTNANAERDGVIPSLGAIEEQATSDWRLTPKDIDTIHDLVDSYIKLQRKVEEAIASPTP